MGYLPQQLPPVAFRTNVDAADADADADAESGRDPDPYVGAVDVLIDPEVRRHRLLYVPAGGPEVWLRLTASQLLTLSGGTEVAVAAKTTTTLEAGGEAGDVGDASGSWLSRQLGLRGAADIDALDAEDGGSGGREGLPTDEGEPKFIVDAMLGRLGRWLRVMGVNVEQIVEPRRTPQAAAALLEAARRTGRIVLTRDGKLPNMAGETTGACYLVHAPGTDEQFGELGSGLDCLSKGLLK